jgi:hypothetical protein
MLYIHDYIFPKMCNVSFVLLVLDQIFFWDKKIVI